jgi:caffeoyl-CoA O-methyltransferase
LTNADIFAAVDFYIEGLFAKEDAALTAAVEEMRAAGMPQISVSPVLGKFLSMLAKIVRARRILEIGTLGGYAAIWLGRALPPDGRMLTLEIDPAHAKVARRNLARAMLLGAVEVREGAALDILQELIASGEEPFDLIFIDADKEPYPEYFELSLRLARPGTLIVADNVIRQGDVIDPAAPESRVAGVRRLAEALANNPAVEATIMQNVGVKGHDGMALILVN